MASVILDMLPEQQSMASSVLSRQMQKRKRRFHCHYRGTASKVPLGSLVAIAESHLSNLRRSRAPELVGSLSRSLPNVASSPVVTQLADPEQLRAESDSRLLEGHSTESLLEAATANADDYMLHERLTALFRRRPEAAAAALALLQKSGNHKLMGFLT
jgi:hypothetical protein